MTGTIFGYTGRSGTLPPLLSWDISHGFGSPCDSFEVSFVYDPAMLSALEEAVRFQARHGGRTVFSGVVDEFELSADRSGCVAVLRGRGMQALLLDNQAEAADYTHATTAFILDRHARPWGVTDIDCTGLESAAGDVSVSSGDSHWSVVRDFARFCGGGKPRFDRTGRLLLDGRRGGENVTVDGKTPLHAQTYTQDRYGVISQVLVKNRVLGSSVTVDNAAFLAQGGSCRRVLNVPRKTGYDAMRHTGRYQIESSQETFRRCSLTVPELFAAFPGDRMRMESSPLGIRGDFLVWSSRCWADSGSAGTVLELVREE